MLPTLALLRELALPEDRQGISQNNDTKPYLSLVEWDIKMFRILYSTHLVRLEISLGYPKISFLS